MSTTSNMPRDIITGLDMEQHSQNVTNFLHPDIPPVNAVPSFEAHSLQEPYDNSSMYYSHPEYLHQHASNFGAGISTAPNYYPPHAAFHAPPNHLLAPGSYEHERNPHFMDHGFKRKSSEGIPGSFQYPSTVAGPPSSFLQLVTPETTPVSFPHYGTYPQEPQPQGQRSVRNTAGAATLDPLLSHGHNNFIQGNYAAPPYPPPGSIWYGQHGNGNRSDGSSSLWSQAPSLPYIQGNAVTGSTDSGNVCFPRYHETSSSRYPQPFAYPGHNYYSHHPTPPPATVYPPIAPAPYTFVETMQDASYSHVGPVQSPGFRINQQHPRDDFIPAAALRHHGVHQLRAMPAYEVAVLEDRYLYGAVDDIDHHEDMRLDIEDMSYEDLLALSDHIGTVKTGLSEEDVKDLLKRKISSFSTRINLEEPPSADPETDSCTICQENYKSRDKIATLDCRHEYHAECLKKWLVIKNVCPICKSEALDMEKKKVR